MTQGTFKRWSRKLALMGAVVIGASACQDLDVVNLNDPDAERALSEPGDLESLIAGTFSIFYNYVHNQSNIAHIMPVFATEQTGSTTGGALEQIGEPRGLYDNIPGLSPTDVWGPRRFWEGANEIAGAVYDGLRQIEAQGQLIVGDVDVTHRSRAFAKFMQGLSWGYMAGLFDQSTIIPESEDLRADVVQQTIESFTPYQEARDIAVASLQEAIAIAQQNNVTFPSVSVSQLWFGTPQTMTTEQFVQLTNTIAARILVLNARTPAERRQVPWDQVLQHTQNGLQSDFEVQLAPGIRQSNLIAAMENDSDGCLTNCRRWDNRLIGLADTSGAYQAWIASPLLQRDRFLIVTPDRRITGVDSQGNPDPQSDGAYTRYRVSDNGFPTGHGLYRRSGYQWARHAHRGYDQANQGTAIMASADENTLLRAEAMLRTGNLAEAAALINVTRTRSHTLPDGNTYPGLPQVTVDGVPQSTDCVPRTDTGACGDLMVALRYERMLELAGYDAFRGWYDSRGFGILPEGTWLQMPIPGNRLEGVFGLPVYTYGGVGDPFGAVYAPVTMADL